ncbi:MAG: hypothetical protein EA369_02950 [Bradymonadales bacterium]|nr:MAG: hypothetical protein EA369_02950 [Bradymonadales bacterium]
MGKKTSRKRSSRKVGESGMTESVVSEDAVEPRIAKSNRIEICKFAGCFDMATVGGFCRLHYLASWKKMKSKEAKKKGKDLKSYLAELSTRFPEEFMEKLKSDIEELSTEASTTTSSESEEKSAFEPPEAGDEDIDTIIRGIRVEDF